MTMPLEQTQPIDEATKFPSFPTMFTEADTARMLDLAQQRQKLEKIFKSKFSPSAWEQVSAPEKLLRTIGSNTVFPTIAKAITPPEWELGFMTPEQFQEESAAVEQEFQELSRRQQVTRVTPTIKDTIRALALTEGGAIASKEDLNAVFHLGELGFNEDEIAYLGNFAQRVYKATPEEVASGDVLQEEPLSQEQIDQLAKSSASSQHVFTSIRFSQDIKDITAALQAKYKPEGKATSVREQLLQDYMDKVRGLSKEQTEKAFATLAEEGQPFVYTDRSTGKMIETKKRSDNSVWLLDPSTNQYTMLGFYNEPTKSIVPMKQDGTPATTPEEQQGVIQSWYATVWRQIEQVKHSLDLFTFTTVPTFTRQILVGAAQVDIETAKQNLGKQERQELTEFSKRIRAQEVEATEVYKQERARREANYYTWLTNTIKTHPELKPRSDWEEGLTDRIGRIGALNTFTDIGYMGNVYASNIYSFMAMGTAIATTALTGNPWIGGTVGFALFTPVETESLMTDFMDNGATYEQATAISVPAGVFISSLEYVGNMPVLKSFTPQAYQAFKKELQKGLSKSIVTKIAQSGATRVTKEMATQIAAETIEEVGQEIAHNAFIKIVDKDRGLFDNVPETALSTVLITIPIAIAGTGASEYHRMKANLPPQVQAKLDSDSQKLQDAGLPKQQAEVAAYSKLVETEEGRAQVEVAKDVIDEKVDDTPPVMSVKERRLTHELEIVNEDITTRTRSIKLQQDRLDKMSVGKELSADIAQQKQLITEMQEVMDELQQSRSSTMKKLEKIRESSKKKVSTTSPAPSIGVRTPYEQHLRELTTEWEMQKKQADSSMASGTITRAEYDAKVDTIDKAYRAAVDNLRSTQVEPTTPVTTQPNLAASRNFEIAQLNAIRSTLSTEEYNQRLNDINIIYSGMGVQATQPIVEPVEEVSSPLLELARDLEEQAARQELDPGLHRFTKRMPGQDPLNLVLEKNEASLREHPDQAKYTSAVKKLLVATQNAYDQLMVYRQLQSSMDVDPTTTDALKKERDAIWRKLAKESGIKKADLIAKNWFEFTAEERMRIRLAFIPDGIVPYTLRNTFLDDARDAMMDWDTQMGTPFNLLQDRLGSSKSFIKKLVDNQLRTIIENPDLQVVVQDKNARIRVKDYINAKHLGTSLQGFTVEESIVGDQLGNFFDDWKPAVRYDRFLIYYNENFELMKEAFKDDPNYDETQLAVAKEIYELYGDSQELWETLFPMKWGVIDEGYYPWGTRKPSLSGRKPSIRAVRGVNRLLQRDSVLPPSGIIEDAIEGYASYAMSLGIRHFMREDINTFADILEASESKWSGKNGFNNAMSYVKGYIEELQGFPQAGGVWDSLVRRLAQNSLTNAFSKPVAYLRNRMQVYANLPLKAELLTAGKEYKVLEQTDPVLKKKLDIFFKSKIDQSGYLDHNRIYWKQELAPLGEAPKVISVPLKALIYIPDKTTALAAKIPYMSASDKATRVDAYNAITVKVEKANKQYQQDGDFKKWYEHSGIKELNNNEQRYVSNIFFQDTHNIGISGLNDLTGQEAAMMKIADLMIQRTLYNYERSAMARAHHGVGGRTYASLLNYPRSTALMYLQQLEKTFGKESTAEQRANGAKNVVLLIISGEIVSGVLSTVTGGKDREYSLLNIFNWRMGGLTWGTIVDVSALVGGIWKAAFGGEEDKKRALDGLPQAITRFLDEQVGFYKIGMDALEALLDEKRGVDTRFFRQVRAIFDKQYTPEQQEKAERSAIEALQKAFAGTEQPDPTKYEKAVRRIVEAEDELGIIQPDGSIFTMPKFASQIESAMKDIPEYMVTKNNNFSDLVLFYQECKDAWDEYQTIPSQPASLRTQWRLSHPEQEAKLLIWGKLSKSVFTINSKEWKEVSKLIKVWSDYYGISARMLPRWDTWSTP